MGDGEKNTENVGDLIKDTSTSLLEAILKKTGFLFKVKWKAIKPF